MVSAGRVGGLTIEENVRMVFIRVDDLTDVRAVETIDLILQIGEKVLERLLIVANNRVALYWNLFQWWMACADETSYLARVCDRFFVEQRLPKCRSIDGQSVVNIEQLPLNGFRVHAHVS